MVCPRFSRPIPHFLGPVPISILCQSLILLLPQRVLPLRLLPSDGELYLDTGPFVRSLVTRRRLKLLQFKNEDSPGKYHVSILRLS